VNWEPDDAFSKCFSLDEEEVKLISGVKITLWYILYDSSKLYKVTDKIYAYLFSYRNAKVMRKGKWRRPKKMV
jgi:hypothetical protein